jgi:acyl carrier protein
MEEKFLRLFAEILEREKLLNLDDKLENIEEWDSLSALALVSMLDDEYGVIMGSKDLERMKTVQDIFDFVVQTQS